MGRVVGVPTEAQQTAGGGCGQKVGGDAKAGFRLGSLKT